MTDSLIQPPSRMPLLAAGLLLLSVDLVLPWWFGRTAEDEVGVVCYLALLAAQVALSAAWLVFGPVRLWLRTASLVPGAAIVWWMVSRDWEGGQRDAILLYLSIHWLLVVQIMLALYEADWRLINIAAGETRGGLRGRHQFSLAQFLAMATIACGVANVMASNQEVLYRDPMLWLVAAATAAVTIAPIPAMLTTRTSGLLAGAAMLAPLASTVLLASFGIAPWRTILFFALGTAAFETGLLAVVRQQGYRLVRLSPVKMAEENSADEQYADVGHA